MQAFSIRHRIALVVLVAIISIGLMMLDRQGVLEPVRTGLRQALTPIESLTDGIMRSGRSDSELQQENDALRSARDTLAAEVARLHDLEEENVQLRALVGVQDAHPDWGMVTARVSFPDPSNLNKFITIDKGYADGIRKGMPVVDPNYFVGLVTEVTEHSARVTLVIDMSSVVGAYDQDTGAAGNAYGMWQMNGRVQMRHIDRASTVKNGNLIVTSFDSSVSTAMVPSGIIIGVVSSDPVLDNQGDSQLVDVVPAADFENLEVVSVIIAYDPSAVVPPGIDVPTSASPVP